MNYTLGQTPTSTVFSFLSSIPDSANNVMNSLENLTGVADHEHFTSGIPELMNTTTMTTASSSVANAIVNGTETIPQFHPPPSVPFDFIVNGIGIMIVAILGIIGNILSAIVLSRPQMRSSVTCLLIGLTFCDSLLIFISILIFGLPSMSDFTGTLRNYRLVYYPLWVPYLFPISITGKCELFLYIFCINYVYLSLVVEIVRISS